jgi:predicted ATPase with chaperone activity
MNHVCIRGSKVILTWIEIIQAYIGQFVLDEIIVLVTHIAIVETLPTPLETKSATIMLVARITMETPNKLMTPLALKLQ